jgi:DNA polymerase-3 subunit delta'
LWNSIIGQSKVIENLKSIYKNNKLAHAFIFYGNDGVGKDAVAIEFAKLLNCQNIINGDEACGVCESCKKITSFSSEYFHFICTLPAGKSDSLDSDPLEKLTAADFDAYLAQLSIKAENPYHHIDLPNANNIRINSIRNLINKIYLSGGRNYKKVFLISEADKMKQEASNALLKILEEPPKNSVIILTTSKINTLPPTIIGRCQKIYFEPLMEEQIIEKLMTLNKRNGNFEHYSNAEIELASKLSGGSYSRTVELLDLGVIELRDLAVNFLVSILKDDHYEVASIVRSISSKSDKARAKYFLFILNGWFKDLLHFNNFPSEIISEKISNNDVSERLSNFSKNFPETDIFEVIMALEEAEKLIVQNVHPPLIFINLSFKLKKLIK